MNIETTELLNTETYTMKLALSLALTTTTLLTSTTLAFLMPSSSMMNGRPRLHELAYQKDPEAREEAIAAAMKATEKFGAQSPEARALWEIVEDLSFDNSGATKAGLNVECDVFSPEPECVEYNERSDAMDEIIMELDDLAEEQKEIDYGDVRSTPLDKSDL